jgi:hypothetical protein
MKFELTEYYYNISDELLIDDVKRVVKNNNLRTITRTQYDFYGKYNSGTLRKRFGGWLKVLEKAGLEKTRNYSITTEELYINLENIWIKLGRQPKRKEIKDNGSLYSTGTYEKKFGNWMNALKSFIEYINQEEHGYDEININGDKNDHRENSRNNEFKHKTKRDISDRLRFKILLRDGFRCKKCGKSPLNEFNVELHVDHIIPWSKGGETIPDNLETKCKECNLGKGNIFNV